MHLLQAINSDISVLIVCNKTGGTIKGDIYKKLSIGYIFRAYIKSGLYLRIMNRRGSLSVYVSQQCSCSFVSSVTWYRFTG